VARVKALARLVLDRVSGQLKRTCTRLRNRYGTRYTQTLLAAVFFTFWLPIPGSSLVAVVLILVVAEAHRAIVWWQRRNSLKTAPC
jgi:hypothetical protein